MSVLSFNYFNVQLQFNLSQHTSEENLLVAIDSIPFKAETQGNPALLMDRVHDLVFKDSRNVQQTLILFMGYSLLNRNEVFESANELAVKGVGIIAFDITSAISLGNLRKIGSRLQNNIQTLDYKFLRSKLPQLGSVVCGAQSGLLELQYIACIFHHVMPLYK